MAQATIDIGSRIQQAREQRGLTHRDVSRMTKLSTSTLKAIEQNEFGRLPGGMFRVAYIRVVAAAVGLDPEELVRAYRAALDAEAPAAPAEAGRLPATRVFGWRTVAVIVVAAAAGAIWLSSRDEGAPRQERVEVSQSWSQPATLPVAVAEAAQVVAHFESPRTAPLVHSRRRRLGVGVVAASAPMASMR